MQSVLNIFTYYETWVVLIPFLVLLFAGCRFMGKGKWNDDVLSFDHTKSFLGFAAIGIILVHCSQKTSAYWLEPQYIKPGLELFAQAGPVFVAAFFFCSGYGMYKSSKKGKSSFDHYFVKRFVPLLIPSVITTLIIVILRMIMGMRIELANPFGHGNPETLHPYIWYVIVLILLYAMFYLCFKVIGSESTGILAMIFLSCLLTLFFFAFSYNLVWFNTFPLFIVGILFAKNEKKVFAFSKKFYVPLVVVTPVAAVAGYFFSFYFWLISPDLQLPLTVLYPLNVLTAFTSVYFAFLAGLKIKIGNPVLSFLGKMTLEIYLVQAIFINLFSYAFIDDGVRSLYYIKNVPLYVLVVLILTIASSFGLYKLDSMIRKKISKRNS